MTNDFEKFALTQKLFGTPAALKYLKLRKRSTSASTSECLNLLPSNSFSLRPCGRTPSWRDEFGHLYQGDECIREEGGEEGEEGECKRFSFIPYTPIGGREGGVGEAAVEEEVRRDEKDTLSAQVAKNIYI